MNIWDTAFASVYGEILPYYRAVPRSEDNTEFPHGEIWLDKRFPVAGEWRALAETSKAASKYLYAGMQKAA